MTAFKSGDLVVLKSGGPTMTVDTVNTDIFDDNKITGVLCVWFVGEKLERVRFDHRAIEPVPSEKVLPVEAPSPEAGVEYKAVLDEMADALNHPAEETDPDRGAVSRKSKRARPARQTLASSVKPDIASPANGRG
jgi:uncharacterized protein YodC (DUF2158 family)